MASDLYEIATVLLPAHRQGLVLMGTVPPAPLALQLNTVRVTKNGMLRPKTALALDAVTLPAARKLAEQAEKLVASGVKPIPDETGLSVYGRDGELALCGFHNAAGKLLMFILSWLATDDDGQLSGASVPAGELGALVQVLREGEMALVEGSHCGNSTIN